MPFIHSFTFAIKYFNLGQNIHLAERTELKSRIEVIQIRLLLSRYWQDEPFLSPGQRRPLMPRNRAGQGSPLSRAKILLPGVLWTEGSYLNSNENFRISGKEWYFTYSSDVADQSMYGPKTPNTEVADVSHSNFHPPLGLWDWPA